MNAAQAQIVYARATELMRKNPQHGFDIDTCPNCGLYGTGEVTGEGDLRAKQHAKPFRLMCGMCKAEIIPVGEDAVVRWMDIVASILAFQDLAALGAFTEAS